MRAMVVREGEVVGLPSYQLRFLAQSPEQTLAITDSVVPPHFPGPIRHWHEEMTDIFYVLEESLIFDIDGVEHRVTRGGFVLIPPGVGHTFANRAERPTRFLNIYFPPGNEHYLKEVGPRITEGSPPSPAEMAEIATRYDFVPLPDEM